ncbi:TadE family protein [Kitasatospora camelliae]|uniref:TadE family protein n=1 Tax=Kitasatospora camelliae TaxID=3156397 RepID=A0AAU8K2U4_9ACTN
MTRRPRVPRPLDRGAVTLSLAILFPVVLLIVMLAVQACLWWYAGQVAHTAVREGVEAGRVRGATPADGDARANEVLARFGDLARPVSVSHGGTDADYLRMTVEVSPQAVLPFFDRMTITRKAAGPRERFVPAGAR